MASSAPADGEHQMVLANEVLDHSSFESTESCFSLLLKDFGNGGVCAVLKHTICVEKVPV